MVYKKKGVNHFPNFNKQFLVNGNHFQFDHHFTVKQTPKNLKIFSEKYFTAKQTEPYIFPTTK
jgi:hypothetical protein